MEEKTKIKKEKNKIKIKKINGTPFVYHEFEMKKFISCGKVKLEIDEDISNTNKWKEFKERKLWELISLLCQAIYSEMINNNNNNK